MTSSALSNKSESIQELAKALCAAQSEITNATKSSSNPFFKSTYADLAEVLNCIKPIITNHGLSFSQMPGYKDGIVSVETLVLHSSGEWLSSVCESPAPKLDPQGIGSAITYLRRYSLSAVFGLAQQDDDGNSQIGNPPQQQTPPQSNQAPRGMNDPYAHKRTPEEKAMMQQAGKPAYPNEQFQANFDGWQQLVASGKKKPDAIVSMIETKYKLSEQQRETILGMF